MSNSIGHITAADSVSIVSTGVGSQTLVKGVPTTGSYVSIVIPDCSSINVTLFGTWSATLVAEQSSSNGDTWTGIGMLAIGTTTTLTTFTGNGALSCNIAAATNFRIRCPASDFVSGSVGVNIVASYGIGSVGSSGSSGGSSGGIFTASPRTFMDQQTGTLSMDSAGNLIVDEMGANPADDGQGAARPYSPGSVAIPTSGAGYVTGNVVGGIISIPTVNFLTGRRVSLTGLTINDKGGVAPALNIYFFPTTPTGGTYTDKSALIWGAADRALCCGQLQVQSGNYLTDIGQSGVSFGGLNTKLNVGATTLFALIIAEGSYTLTNGNLSIVPQFNQE